MWGAIISGVTPTVIGRYRVIEHVGQGAMGSVFRCRDDNLERDVAVKVMSVAQSAQPDARARFAREARAAARLQHPNIITIYELGEHQGTPFIAMEYLEGVDLQRAITAGVRPDPRVTLPIALQILAGLAHAHEHGIVHRDIKPSNIFLPRRRPAKIMDFGVARLTSSATTAGTIVGTPNYMSPEQVKGGVVDGRSDLFSTALILYELVTGERAFRGSSVVAVLYLIANERPDLSLLPRAQEWGRLQRVVTRALAQDVQERYPDAPAMASELAQALEDLGGSPDWASASDRGLLVRHNLRPARPANVVAQRASTARTDTPTAAAPPPMPTDALPRTGPAPRATIHGPRGVVWLFAVCAVAAVAALVVLLALRRPARKAAPEPASSLGSGASAGPATLVSTPMATPALVSPPTPVALPSLAPAATSAQTGAPTSRLTVASPPGSTLSTGAPGRSTARLEHANALFEARHYQSALNEAQALLARQPEDEEARALAEDARAALLVEEKLRMARAAVARGDRTVALIEVRAGLAAAPNDARLLSLQRQLTR